MKFFFGARYEERVSRGAFGGLVLRLVPRELFVLCDNGQRYHQDKFPIFGGQRDYDRFYQFLKDNADGEPTEMIGWGRPSEYAVLLAAVDGMDAQGTLLPRTFTNLGQSLIEYMDFMDDESFAIGTGYRFRAVPGPNGFTLQQKMEMFLTHRNCPEPADPETLVTRVRYTADVYAFFREQRDLTISLYNIPTIEDDGSSE